MNDYKPIVLLRVQPQMEQIKDFCSKVGIDVVNHDPEYLYADSSGKFEVNVDPLKLLKAFSGELPDSSFLVKFNPPHIAVPGPLMKLIESGKIVLSYVPRPKPVLVEKDGFKFYRETAGYGYEPFQWVATCPVVPVMERMLKHLMQYLNDAVGSVQSASYYTLLKASRVDSK